MCIPEQKIPCSNETFRNNCRHVLNNSTRYMMTLAKVEQLQSLHDDLDKRNNAILTTTNVIDKRNSVTPYNGKYSINTVRIEDTCLHLYVNLSNHTPYP